ncbi:MAG: glycosyltransferase family 2 protein [Bacteroidetes bacterium]|nr:glycosyltransferase family 2 protein [Bacteroidota bacterium]
MADNPIKLSVVIITRNEERNIERCLQSVQDISDETVVVDSFSSDRTEEICSGYAVKFFKNEFKGHIEQKNYALSQAKYNHVLALDADESLSTKLIENLQKVKSNFSYDGYYLNRLTNYCGKWIRHSGWYPDRKLRLFDKSKGRWTGENPHDRFELFQDYKSSRLGGDLLHYSFYNIDQHLDTIKKFTTIAAEAKFRKESRASCFDLIIRPIWKFSRNYFFRLGFLDGYYGLVVCVLSSYATFIRYAKLKQLHKMSHLEKN